MAGRSFVPGAKTAPDDTLAACCLRVGQYIVLQPGVPGEIRNDGADGATPAG